MVIVPQGIFRRSNGDPVFLASDGFSLNYEAERWKAITFEEVKEYQIGIAA